MKKFILISFVFLLLFPFAITERKAKADSTPIYAKIMYENVYFYSLPTDDEANKLFELPKTYFVLLHSKQSEDFYYAQYHDIFGYVKKQAVSAMKGIPEKPFAISSFRVFSLDGIGLYKLQNNKSEKLADIPYLSEELIYYGSISGQELIPNKSREWYYAKYTTTSCLGYVYSVFCDNLVKFEENNESFEQITSPLFTEEQLSSKLSTVSMTFIIIGVSLPCLVVLYLLVKPSMIKEKLTKQSPKLRAKGRNDYFEFDESDLN